MNNQKEGITAVIQKTKHIGDKLSADFEAKKEIKSALGAIAAYRTAVSGAKTQLNYQKALNAGAIVKRINFLEV